MKTFTHKLRAAVLAGLFILTSTSGPAQVPDTLKLNIPAPPGRRSGIA